MFDKTQARELIGRELRTTDGTTIGKIGQVYLDDYHDAPEWVTVNTGLFGSNESFVPLAEATLADGGVVVPYTKDQIKDAPNIAEDGRLTEEEERTLYQHYGVPYTTEGSTFADTAALGGTSGTTSTGAKPAIAVATIALRQVNSSPVLIPCRSATALATAPGSKVSRTIRSLSSGDQFRRRTARTRTSTPEPVPRRTGLLRAS